MSILKWLPIITFGLITPCGSNTFCIPMFITLPVGLLAGDLNGILPICGLIFVIYSNISGLFKNRILFTIGILMLIISIFKNMYDTSISKSYEYVWNDSITYFSLGLFVVCSVTAIIRVSNINSKQVNRK